MSPQKFSWLHFTDLHWDDDSINAQYWPNIKGELFADLEWMREQTGPWDCIFFTGDLTKCGSNDNYKGLNQTFIELFEKLVELNGSDTKPILLPVPGNHDLVRPNLNRGELDSLLKWDEDCEFQNEFWDEQKPSSYRRKIGDAFQNYIQWYKGFNFRPHVGLTWGKLPGDFSYKFSKGDYSIGIVGLNSSYLHLSDEFTKGKLALNIRQLNAVCDNDAPNWTEQNNVNILLTHHPPNWFGDNAKEEFYKNINPNRTFDLHLHGHLHAPRSTQNQIGGSAASFKLQGSSLFSNEKWGDDGKERKIHGYSGGAFYFEANRVLVEIWPRIATETQNYSLRIGPDVSYSIDRWTQSIGNKTKQPKGQLTSPAKESDSGTQYLNSLPQVDLTIADSSENDISYYNSEFYRKLIGAIRNAKDGAIIVGHGFDFFGRESKHYAHQYLRTICNTAERLHIFRIEFSRSGSQAWPQWIEMMANYMPLSDPTSNRGVTLLKPIKNFSLLKNCAVFDWDGKHEPFSVIMFPKAYDSKGSLGMKQDVRADTGIFIRHPNAVRTIYENLERIIFKKIEFGKELNEEHFKVISSKEELIHEYLESKKINELEDDWKNDNEMVKKPYFAYGSNIKPSRVKIRAPNARNIGIATLGDHHITFRNPAVPGIDSVATIEAKVDNNVIGVLYNVSKGDKRRLAFYEGVDDDIYIEKDIDIQVYNDGEFSSRQAFTYVLRSGFHPGKPNPNYLSTITDGLTEIKNNSNELMNIIIDNYIHKLKT